MERYDVQRTVFNTCRFCLGQDKACLVPLAIVTDSTLTLADIEYFTGIEGLNRESNNCMICDKCDAHLNNVVAFRDVCRKNDHAFRQLADPDCIVVVAGRAADLQRKEQVAEDNFEVGRTDEMDDSASLDRFENITGWDESDDDRDAQTVVSVQNEPKHTPKTNAGDSANKVKKKKKRTPIRPMLCETCGAIVKNLPEHMRSHTKEKPFACTHCDVKMTNKTNLVRHIQSVHLKKPIVVCKTCNKPFMSMGPYKLHLLKEHGIGSKYQCHICSKSFNRNFGLKLHIISMHTSERKLKCSICGTRHKLSKNLRQHMLTHYVTERLFVCSFCPKRFRFKKGKKVHELTHTGFMFPCEHCDKSFRYQTQRYQHIKKAHPEPDCSSKTDEQ